jgi:hypothetical protein
MEPKITNPTTDHKQDEMPLQVPEDGIFETYANIIDADWTLTDVTFRFSQLIHASPSDATATTINREKVVLERANITVPWWQVKLLASTLGALVQSYESVNGELKRPELPPLPPSMIPSTKQ